MGDLREKLIRLERTINIYNQDNQLINEILIDVPFESLVQIVHPNNDDPELFDGYELNETQLDKINKFIEEPVQHDFGNFSYYLVTGGIYDW